MNRVPVISNPRRVPKGWGHELIFANTPEYTGKLLVFTRGKKGSMHFHMKKKETWYVVSGLFQLLTIHPSDASEQSILVHEGEVVHLEPGVVHQVLAMEDTTLLEVSTPDLVEDSYRIRPGDSQFSSSSSSLIYP